MSILSIGTIHLPELEDVSTDRAPKMIHLFDLERDGMYALCGARLTENTPGEVVDCVVCEDIWENRRRQH